MNINKHFLSIGILILWICSSGSIKAQLLEPLDTFSKGFPEYGKEKLYEDRKGFIWLAGSNGLHRWDGKEWSRIKIFDNVSQQGQMVFSVLQNRSMDYIFACADRGAKIYKNGTNEIIELSDFSFDGKKVKLTALDITETAGYKLLLATVQGLIVLDNNGTIISIDRPGTLYADKNISGHNSDAIRKAYYHTQSGTYYFGGNGGLFSRQVNSDSILHHPMTFYNAAMPDSIGNHQIQDMLIDDGHIICTTWGGGVAVYNIFQDQWRDYRYKINPGNSVAISILQIAEDSYLVTQVEKGTGRSGVNLLHRDSTYIRPLKNEAGVAFEYANAITRDNNGKVWIGERHSVNAYKIRGQSLVNNPISIYVRSLEIEGQAIPSDLGIMDDRLIEISNEAEQLEFSYRAINALNYDNISYEYKIWTDKKDGDWISNGNSEIAQLMLPSGTKFFLSVRAVNPFINDYIYSGTITLVRKRIDLNKRSTWILLGTSGFLILFTLGLLLHWLNSRRLRIKEEKWKMALSEIQNVALRSQMNPHFVFNCMNSIRYFIVKEDKENALKYMTKFSRLIRQILESSEKELIPLTQEVKMLELYLEMEKLRFENKFTYKIDSSNVKDAQSLAVPPMLIQPFVENALIHGLSSLQRPGYIEISFSTSSMLTITITDNGVGIQATSKNKIASEINEKKSLGMQITNKRIELIKRSSKATIELSSIAPYGTQVTIHLPLMKLNASD